MEKLKNTLELTVYNKGGSTWYCDYYFCNGLTYEIGTTKAGGYGYDKHSTALSQAINHFNYLFTFKRGITWDGSEHSKIKNRSFYGCGKSKHIGYGIGASSVLNCLGLFNNVKLIEQHYGKYEDYFKIEILTTNEQLKKELERLEKAYNKELKEATTKDYTNYIKKGYKNKKAKIEHAMKWGLKDEV